MDTSMLPMWKGMSYLFPVVTFIGMQFFPSALQLYFVGTGLFGVFQAYLLNNNNFRRFANITIPVRHQDTGATTTGPLHSLHMLGEEQRARQAELRKQAEAAGLEKQLERLSFIDRQMKSISEKFSSFKDEAGKVREQAQNKTDELLGKQQAKSANGPSAVARRSKEETQQAAEYEKKRMEEENFEREMRNLRRRERYNRRRQKQ